MREPIFLRDDDELNKFHLRAHGLIYNDYSGNVASGAIGNVLHLAGCRHVGKSNTKAPKLFFGKLEDAMAWISRERGPEGARWRRCTCCRPFAEVASPALRQGKPLPSAAFQRMPSASRRLTGGTRESNPSPFTEGQVEDFLQPWLELRGYAVSKRVRVANGIIDMVAHGDDGEWIIEAKGEDRGGFGTSEMNFRIGIAQICSRRTGRVGQKSALAIPFTPQFQKVLRKHRDFSVFEKMDIWLFVARADGTITKLAPDQVQAFVDELAFASGTAPPGLDSTL